jgi:hypothetical protein
MENGTINIRIITPKGKETLITVRLDETISSAKEKFYNKVGSREKDVWKCNGTVLKDNDIFSDIGIEDEDVIYVSRPSIGGGFDPPPFGVNMADISNKRGLVEGNFNKNAKEWNIITKGLNVTGICKNDQCRACNNKVDCRIGLGTFDLVRDADRIKCPICKEEMEPLTCCFSKCQYKFEGKKRSNGKTEYVKSEWKRVEKDYEYYDPIKSGTVNWLMLIIETKSL